MTHNNNSRLISGDMDLFSNLLSRSQAWRAAKWNKEGSNEDGSSLDSETIQIDSPLITCEKMEPVLSTPVYITDMQTGVQNRSYYRRFMNDYGSDNLMMQLNQIDRRDAKKMENMMIERISIFREFLRLPKLEVVEEMVQVARAQSQFYAGNCMKDFIYTPFLAFSISVRRDRGKKMKPYADAVMQTVTQGLTVSTKMGKHSLKYVGVGVWGTSHEIIVTIVF